MSRLKVNFDSKISNSLINELEKNYNIGFNTQIDELIQIINKDPRIFTTGFIYIYKNIQLFDTSSNKNNFVFINPRLFVSDSFIFTMWFLLIFLLIMIFTIYLYSVIYEFDIFAPFKTKVNSFYDLFRY